MEPTECRRLKQLAEREGVSIAELVRRAVERYFLLIGPHRKQKAIPSLFGLNPIPIGD